MFAQGLFVYGALAVAFFMLAYVAVTYTVGYARKVGAVMFIMILPLIYVTSIGLTSHPRPVQLIPQALLPDVEEADMLADYMVEDEFIMLLMMWDGLEYPRWYRFPWDRERAEQIQDAKNRAEEEGSPGVVLELPFDNSLERRDFPFAHPIPQLRQMPNKPDNEPDRLEFDGPSEDA